LNISQKILRVAKSKELLSILEKEERNNFIHVYTGDESWFYFSYPITEMWTPSKNKVKTKPIRLISTQK
jgi:hypothetical protein